MLSEHAQACTSLNHGSVSARSPNQGVCVCVRERGRELQNQKSFQIFHFYLLFYHGFPAHLSLCSLQFLYALPQKEGYEFFVGQWSRHELHFTSLINIQTLGENAPSQLILYHYLELKEEKGIVLMTAEMDPKFITVHQAQCLANQVQLFYGTQRQETYRLVETFNHQPEDFKHMSVIAELEQSGLGSAGTPGGS
ncbi:ATP synthase mitochondrial F1 complex assembly factor 1 [Xiphophorus hellerii]|uniref:ATP synthase mitochondrial F1 complex assembly factor 1 n=1 Tax=Xiphophorus hellerii TaxID=8084 RepID=UPI0013B389CB|nr:ATP synthase mitochondrial F1 complex assembly factor 1 [Xiphophorus hellerii]